MELYPSCNPALPLLTLWEREGTAVTFHYVVVQNTSLSNDTKPWMAFLTLS